MPGILSGLMGLGGLGCDPALPKAPTCLALPSEPGAAVARVGDVPITVATVVARLKEQGSGALKRYDDRTKLREFVEDQIRLELLANAALERGFAQDPEVVAAARKVMVRKLLQHDLLDNANPDEVPESEIQAYYTQHLSDYRQPEKLRLLNLELLPTETGHAKARALLARLQARPNDRGLFKELAATYSQERQSAERGGELLPMSHDELLAAYGQSFAKDVFTLAPGELTSVPIQSTRGWHVVRLLSRREALTRSIDEVRVEIREKLVKGQRAKDFDKYLADIRKRYPVAMYDDQLDVLRATLFAAP